MRRQKNDAAGIRKVPTTSKFCWKCLQIHLIDLRIQYGTLKLHSLADFEKILKKSAESRFWGGLKKFPHGQSISDFEKIDIFGLTADFWPCVLGS